MSLPAVSIVLPVANQADHIEGIVGAYLEALRAQGTEPELVLVVNASRDASLDVANRLASQDAGVKAIESAPGWGRAVRAGLRHATADLVGYTNSARTDPRDLAIAVRYAQVNPEVLVKASRKVRDSLVRRLGSVIYNFEARMLFGLAVWDINGTPTLFHRSLMGRLAPVEDGDLIDLELMAKCKRMGIPIVEMPVYPGQRHGGRSTTNLASALHMYLGAFALRRRLLRG